MTARLYGVSSGADESVLNKTVGVVAQFYE